MKAYADSNVYLSYLLEERNWRQAEEFFGYCIEGRFTAVSSKFVWHEIIKYADCIGPLRLERFVSDLRGSGRLLNVDCTTEERDLALKLNLETADEFGYNDFMHAILASRHADVFVSNDLKFSPTASKIVKTMTLHEFLRGL